MMYGSCILVKLLKPANVTGIFMLTGEEGGSGGRAIARCVVDRWIEFPDLILALACYDFH